MIPRRAVTSRRAVIPRGNLTGRLRLRSSDLPIGQDERHATWLELFSDVIFVLALATVQNRLRDNSSPQFGLLAGTFGLYAVIWFAWVGQVFYDTRFDPDDIIHRLSRTGRAWRAPARWRSGRPRPRTRCCSRSAIIVVRATLIVLYLRVRNSRPGRAAGSPRCP